jgi:tRNA (guanine-N7-)-methyltransferase
VPRVRQHVNPLKSDLLEIADVPRIEAPAGRSIEVDRALADRETLFVGVEIRRDLIEIANAGFIQAGVANARSVFANMSVDMPRLFAAGSVRRFFLNFPDPWFKSRQHKRRVIGPPLIAEVGRALAPGGELYVMTDIFALALEAMAALETSELFESARGPWSFAQDNPYGAKSRRERQCEGEGARVWRLLYRRVAPVAAAAPA